MRGKGHWSNTPGSVSINVGYDTEAGAWIDDDNGRMFPYIVECLLPRPCSGDDAGEIVIYFQSSGYYDPGKTSGLPENCYPPEGEDERIVNDAIFRRSVFEDGYWRDSKPIHFTAAAIAELEDMYQKQIDDADIDTTPDEPDWDSITEERQIRRSEQNWP